MTAIARIRSLIHSAAAFLGRLLGRQYPAPTSGTSTTTKLAALLAWGRAHPERIREAKRRWNHEHLGVMRANNQRWRERNREHVNAYANSYYHAHRERILQRQRELRAARRQAGEHGAAA
jgi:hypothetical protein